jgi:diguanylate cyclase (GGDEF)-like protein
LLVAAARRLDQIAHASDIVARVGGDDFAVLFEVADEEQARTVAERLLDRLQAPLVLGGERIAISASVGSPSRAVAMRARRTC